LEKGQEILKIAHGVFDIEADAIRTLKEQLNEHFSSAVLEILHCKGKVIVCGMGKSGHIGKKIAATLASTGTPSFFIHPAEAFHGDLGMIAENDIFIGISNSGETEEIIKLIPALKENGNRFVAITGQPASTLGVHADFVLNVHVSKEACPLALAPTASTTAALAMGDALAVALMEQREFKPENFARFHPGGSLGRKLLTRVRDTMRTDNLPVVAPGDSLKNLILTMTEGKLGMAIVVDSNKLVGIVTDGDLRRAWARFGKLDGKVPADIMTAHPKTINPDAKLAEAEQQMMQHKITTLVVEEATKVVGVLQVYGI
jgi:arabinose-5-phosphate isomerase